MKTIIVKKIDGYDIVGGFSQTHIDPEGTKKAIKALELYPEENQVADAKLTEINNLLKNRLALINSAALHYENKDMKKLAMVQYEIEQRNEQISQLRDQHIELLKLAAAKQKEIWKENAVYFEAKKGEKCITDDEFYEYSNLLTEAKKDKCVVSVDKKPIADLRGVKFVENGKLCQVDKLGENVGGPLMKDVTPEQFEVMRFDNLTAEEKTAEYDMLIDGLQSQADNMRGKLEITGDNSALVKAQEWYNSEVVKADMKYAKA